MTDTAEAERLDTVFEAFVKVMADVQGIGKNERNATQGFNFRGIDATMNTVGPVLRRHGVFIVPKALSLESERYLSKQGAQMRNVTVEMQYAVFGPAGDTFVGSAYGEAADSGDKAVSKAQSVAYRTFLLQGLTVPTEERDPDADAHERDRPMPTPSDILRDLILATLDEKRIEPGLALDKFADDNNGADINKTTNVAALQALLDYYRTLDVSNPDPEPSAEPTAEQPPADEPPQDEQPAGPSATDKARVALRETLKYVGIPDQDAVEKFARDNDGASLKTTEDTGAVLRLLTHYRGKSK